MKNTNTQVSDWGPVFAKRISVRGLVSRIKNSQNLIRQKKQPHFYKSAEDLKRHFTEDSIRVEDKHAKKRCSASLTVREIQTKATVRYPNTDIRRALNLTTAGVGEDVEHWPCGAQQPCGMTIWSS